MAIAAANGGGGYWHPHRGDDPMGMIISEFIPLCRRLGLGRPPQRIGTLGISMGGYGALLLAEKYPRLISATAAIGPAVWTSYPQARAANPGAYASAADFAANDVVTHAAALADVAVQSPAASTTRSVRVWPRWPGRCRRGLSWTSPMDATAPVLRGPGTPVAGLPGPPSHARRRHRGGAR